MNVDWYDIAARPEVRAIASTIRRGMGVWVAAVAADGEWVELDDADEKTSRALWRRMGDAAFTPREPTHTSRAVTSAESAGARGEPEHVDAGWPGLAAVRVAVRAPGVGVVGHVWGTGFLRSSGGAAPGIQLRRALSEGGVGDELADETFDEVPTLREVEEFTLAGLLEAIRDAIERRLREVERLGGGVEVGETYCGMLGTSSPMRRLFAMMERAARSDATVLILGENGTGKELVASGLHRRSRRRAGSFVVQNCAAIPANLMESELFGHKRGAFSGAHKDREGLFTSADGGTFFLDEIGEMEVSLQSKLLRVLQEGTFLPVGASQRVISDARVVCATNRDVREMVREGSFRQDLYYRVAVITLQVPALRERPSDIPTLARHFASKAAWRHGLEARSLSDGCVDALKAHTWPGNVRELENEIERLVIMNPGVGPLGAGALSARVRDAPEETSLFQLTDMSLPDAVDRLERQMILDTLRENGWNKTQAARTLGVSRRNLIRKVAAFGFEEESS